MQSLFGSKKDKAHRVSHGWQGSEYQPIFDHTIDF